MIYLVNNITYRIYLFTTINILVQLCSAVPSFATNIEKNTKDRINILLDSALFYEKKEQKKSLAYYKEALKLAKAEKLNTLISKAYYGIINYHYRQFDYTSTYQFADTLLKNNPTEYYQMLALERKGDAHWYTGQFDSSGYYYHKVKVIAENIQDSIKSATIQRDLGDYYRQTGDYKSAIEYFNNAINLLIQLKDTSILSGVYNNFSIVFSSMGDYHKQLEYLLKAYEIKKSSEDYAALALYTKNMADVYLQLKEYSKALEKSRESNQLLKKSPFLRFEIYVKETTGRAFYHLNQLDSAQFYFTEALLISDSIGEKRYQARVNKCLGDIKAKLGLYDSADQYYKKAFEYYKLIEDPVYEAKTYISMADNSIKLRKIQRAYNMLHKAQLLANTYGNKSVLIDVYSRFASYYENKNELRKSISFFKKLDSLKKVVFNEDRVKYISANEIIFDTKMRELENINLKKNIALQNIKYSTQSNKLKLGIIGIIACLLIALSFYYAYRKTRFSKLKIALKNKQLQKKNTEIEEANRQQMDLIHLVAHDLKSPLNKIQGLANILKLENDLSKEQLELVQMMEQISNNSRKFIINLLEAQDVEQKALEPDLKLIDLTQLIAYCNDELQHMVKSKSQQVNISSTHDQNLFLNIDEELMKHALLNLFSNAVKFSPLQSTIYFEVNNNESHVQFHIIDEGPGFTLEDQKKLYSKFQKLSAKPTNSESSTGLGLYLVKSLIEKMKGEIFLEPTEHGAHFIINMPFYTEKINYAYSY